MLPDSRSQLPEIRNIVVVRLIPVARNHYA
jgi:hypothetical protein